MYSPMARRRVTCDSVVVVVVDGEPIAEVAVTEAPAPSSVVPSLIATSNVVVLELLHGFEGVKTTAVDRCSKNTSQTTCRLMFNQFLVIFAQPPL